jgi:hypothetical protein
MVDYNLNLFRIEDPILSPADQIVDSDGCGYFMTEHRIESNNPDVSRGIIHMV